MWTLTEEARKMVDDYGRRMERASRERFPGIHNGVCHDTRKGRTKVRRERLRKPTIKTEHARIQCECGKWPARFISSVSAKFGNGVQDVFSNSPSGFPDNFD